MRQVHFSDEFCLESDLPKIRAVQSSASPSHSSDISDLCTLMKDMKADNASMLKLLQQMVNRPPSSPRSPGSPRPNVLSVGPRIILHGTVQIQVDHEVQ